MDRKKINCWFFCRNACVTVLFHRGSVFLGNLTWQGENEVGVWIMFLMNL